MPTLPKDPAVRQRTNKASTRAVLPAVVGVKAPPMPKTAAGGQRWGPRARAWWAAIWRSPMAAMWLEADVEQLYMGLELVEQFWRAPKADTLKELRQVIASFGLDPIARRRLEWKIAPPEQAKKAAAPPPRVEDDDPRDALTGPAPN